MIQTSLEEHLVEIDQNVSTHLVNSNIHQDGVHVKMVKTVTIMIVRPRIHSNENNNVETVIVVEGSTYVNSYILYFVQTHVRLKMHVVFGNVRNGIRKDVLTIVLSVKIVTILDVNVCILPTDNHVQMVWNALTSIAN
jgi:hypothetical protein